MPRIINYPVTNVPRATDVVVIDSIDQGTKSVPIGSLAGTKGIAYQGRDSLRAEAVHINRQVAYLDYLLDEDDGQGGTYLFRESSTEADNGSSILRPDNIDSGDPGRWHLSFNRS